MLHSCCVACLDTACSHQRGHNPPPCSAAATGLGLCGSCCLKLYSISELIELVQFDLLSLALKTITSHESPAHINLCFSCSDNICGPPGFSPFSCYLKPFTETVDCLQGVRTLGMFQPRAVTVSPNYCLKGHCNPNIREKKLQSKEESEPGLWC